MAKKITVRTVKAQPKVQMPPAGDSAPADAAAAPGAKKPLAMATGTGPVAQGAVPERLQNPFENAAHPQLQAKPENYTWQAILMLLATLMVLGIIGIQYFEWDLYTGGFNPVFMKSQPIMGAPMLPPPAVGAGPVTDAAAADDMADDMAEDDVLPE